VEDGGHAEFLDHLVEDVGGAVVREEPLQAGVELEAADAVLGNQAAGLPGTGQAAGRVDGGE
jgi:hypothetical protein